jgi:hypothetical protein
VRTTEAARRICERCQVHSVDSESNKQSHEHQVRGGRLKLDEGQLHVHVFRRKCKKHKMLNHVKKTYTHETSFISFEYVYVNSPLDEKNHLFLFSFSSSVGGQMKKNKKRRFF